LLAEVAETRDKYGAESQAHVNELVAKSLLSAFAPAHKAGDERTLVLEIMTAMGILQPKVIATLLPDLPSLVMTELRAALGLRDGRPDVTPITRGVLYLSSVLHISPDWLNQYWSETGEMMAACIAEGQGLAVLKGIGVVLDATA
jgi:hypothetical protein